MSAAPETVQIVAEWIGKAENDFRTATITLDDERGGPTDRICFHAQQCVEKYLKGLLVLCGQPFPKTHDLETICALLPESWRPDLPPKVLERFTAYATVTRYPGEYAEITEDEARSALSVARRVRKHVRTLVPAEAIRRRRR
jgi:HEPN domain-containing protein